MADRPLVDYIKQMTATGADREAIKVALASAGWSPKDTEDGLAAAYAELAQPTPTQKPAGITNAQPSPVSLGVQSNSVASQPLAASAFQPQSQPQPQMRVEPQAQPVKIEPIQIKQTPVATTTGAQPTGVAGISSAVVLKSHPAAAAYNPVILNNISSGAEASKVKKSPSLAIIISVSAIVILSLGGGAAWYFLMGPGAAQEAAVTQTPDTSSVIPQVSNLGLDQVKNAKYFEDGKEIQFSNGGYMGPLSLPLSAASGTQVVSSSIIFSKAAFDDLNADGNGDAAVILRRKDPGYFEIPQLAVLLNQAGQPNFADIVNFSSGTIVRSVSSDHGAITVSMLVKASGTIAFYPDQEVSQTFTLVNGKLFPQTPVLGMRIFNHAQIADFEGRSFLVYQFSYLDSDVAVKAENQNRIIITEKNSSLNHSLAISYEGARGYSPMDYWNQVLKKNCVGCAIVSSTSDIAVMGSVVTSSAVIIPGVQNTITIENKANKWVIWGSPSGTAGLFVAQLQKPTDAIERILKTFLFVDWVDSATVSSSAITPLPAYLSAVGSAVLKNLKDVSEIITEETAFFFGRVQGVSSTKEYSAIKEGGIWKVSQ